MTIPTARSTLRSARLWQPILMIALLVLACGCNVVSWRADGIRDTMRAAGLQLYDQPLGDAQVHYWASASLDQPAAATEDRRPIALLVHGFGASAMWQWHEQVGPLSRSHRLVVPDLLWFGESTSSRRDYSLDYQVAVTLALLDHLGADTVDAVGISYGGLVAYELASQHPERLHKLVIVDSPGRVYQRSDYQQLCARFSVEHIGDVLLPKTNEQLTTLLELAYYDAPWTPDWALTQVREALYADHLAEKRALLDALVRDLEVLTRRPDPLAPTLLIWGSDDPVFPLSIGRRLQRHLGSGTRLAVIPLARHAPNLEYADDFNAILLPFLRH